MKYLLVLLSLPIFLLGCQSSQKKLMNSSEGQFRARALIKDLKQRKSFIVNLNFNVVRGQVLRLDVSSPLSQHLASFVVTPKELSYIMIPDKTFYLGKSKDNAMASLLPVPINPAWLENILFRKAFESKDWLCTQGKGDMVDNCENLKEKINIRWSQSENKKPRVDIKHPSGEIQMNFHMTQSKVEDGVSLETLKAPKGFRTVR